MSRRVAILTPPESGLWYGSRWPDVLARMVAPLEATGLSAKHRPWTEAVDTLASFDLVLPLLAWGYHQDSDWQARIGEWEAAALPLRNPASVLAWNADKLYLQRLASRAPVVPTLFVDRVGEDELRQAAASFGVNRLVAKPRVSAGAFQTIRWSPGDTLEDGPSGAAMIQPYLPSIESSGEISLIYLGGRFSHAISKVPQPGDFRVQPEYDGIIAPHAPAPEEIEAAETILSAIDEDLLYARIDMVRDLSGNPALMELELVEPDLYLGYDNAAPGRFAEAVKSALP